MGVTASITRGRTRPIAGAITGMGASPGVFSPAAAVSGADISVSFTTQVNLLTSDNGNPGVVGFYWSIGEGVAATNWQDVAADEAFNHSFTVPLATIGAVAGDVINIDPGYSLTSPYSTIVAGSDSGSYVTPAVYTVVYDDTTPTEGVDVTLSFDYIIGPPDQVVTYRHTASTDGVVGTAATYTPTAGVVGETLTGRVTSTLGSLSGFDDSDATSAVASAGAAYVQDWAAAMDFASGSSNAYALGSVPGAGKTLIAVVRVQDETATVAFSDDIGDGVSWSTIGPVQLAGAATTAYIGYKKVGTPSGGGKTITATVTGGFGAPYNIYLNACEVSLPVGALDASGTRATFGTDPALSASLTTTVSSGLIIGWLISLQAATADGSYVSKVANDTFCSLQSRLNAASGSHNPSFTALGSNYVLIGAAFK